MNNDYYIIDADGHIAEEQADAIKWEEWLEEPYKAKAPKHIPFETGGGRLFIEGKIYGRTYATRFQNIDRGVFQQHQARTGMWDPKVRLQHMDKEGIDVSVIFGGAIMNSASTYIDGKFATAMCRAYNNWMHRFCSASPKRLKAVSPVSLQNIEEGVDEVGRAVTDLGAVAVSVTSNVHGRNIHEPAFAPLFSTAESLDIPVCVHLGGGIPGVHGAGTERFKEHLYVHLFTHPFEQMIAVSVIICSGILDRHPKLRVAFLEGGVGWVPFWMERLDEHYATCPGEVDCKAKPSEYIKGSQLYFSGSSEEVSIPFVSEVIGEDRLMYSSDYWHFDAKFWGSVADISQRTNLSDSAKRKILAENAARLYKLPVSGHNR